MSDDPLGDRMKAYEMAEAGRHLMPRLPVLARLDGRCFSRFTQRMARPFERGLATLMLTVTENLVSATGARAGYTQSDEITLLYAADSERGEIFFNGRIQKMTSVLAAMCSTFFNQHASEWLQAEHLRGPPQVFDCRVWAVPSPDEAANAFLWREMDATKNSVQMAARCHYSANELFGKSSKEMQAMLLRSDVNWNDYPSFFKRGTYVLRKRVSRKFTEAEISSLPPQHNARTNPDLCVERWVIEPEQLPPLGTVKNRVDVLFHGAAPEVGP